MEGVKLMYIISCILSIGVGVVASWLLGFLLIDREKMRELELQWPKEIETD